MRPPSSTSEGSELRAALFDLDRTLLDCNSGGLWVLHEWRRGVLRTRDLAWAGYWLGRYHLGMGAGLERVFEDAARSVAGVPEAELEARVHAWFATEVQHRLRPGGRAALEHHRQLGERLVLATSGSLYAARAATEEFGLDDVVCTRFEVVDGVLTGGVAELALGPAKADRAEEWARHTGIDLADCTFYTDSATDLALMERVGRPVAVNPDRALARICRERGWERVDWGQAP